MREKKYRGWNKIKGRMFDPKVLTPLAVDAGISEKIPDGVFLPFHEDVEIVEHINLTDKNGVEGYENDTLGGLLEGVYIDWCDKCKQYTGFFRKPSGGDCAQCEGDVHWYEIVECINAGTSWFNGNIYEDEPTLERG